MALKGNRVLITGGTGSFGRAFARRLLEEDECQAVIIFSRDEWKQWEMRRSDPIFQSPKVRYFLGDIRDKERLKRAFNEVDTIVHAAALKQVPAAEYNPTEFVKTNVIGAMHLIDAAIDCKVKKVLALSTDKAMNPVNLYGATKLCAEKLFIAANSYVGTQKIPGFSVIRYGNVLGSRGSIIPLWKEIIAKGEKNLPITDPAMTRFWVTLEQAVERVLTFLDVMQGGEIFVPKIPSMKITDLAKALAPNLNHVMIGTRPGEKVHELLVSKEDAPYTYDLKTFFVIAPQVVGHFQESPLAAQGKKVPSGFSYSSDNNTEWLTVDELKNSL